MSYLDQDYWLVTNGKHVLTQTLTGSYASLAWAFACLPGESIEACKRRLTKLGYRRVKVRLEVVEPKAKKNV